MSISGEECDKAIANVFKYLDGIDLMPYINKFKYRKLDELMAELSRIFPYEDEYSTTLFDAIAEDEFVDYLNKKYDVTISEETISYYFIR